MHNTMNGRNLRPTLRVRSHAAAALAVTLISIAATQPALAGSLSPMPTVAPVSTPYYAPATSHGQWDGAYFGFTMGYNFRGRDRVQLAPAPRA